MSVSNGLAQIERPAARTDLTCQRIDGEMLLYDKRAGRAHRLNATAVQVWDLCDGTRSPAALIEAVIRSSGEHTADTVTQALTQFSLAGLLEGTVPARLPVAPASRRTFMRWGAAVAAAGAPLVVSLAAPPAAHAVTCIEHSGTCAFSSQCCPKPGATVVCCQQDPQLHCKCKDYPHQCNQPVVFCGPAPLRTAQTPRPTTAPQSQPAQASPSSAPQPAATTAPTSAPSPSSAPTPAPTTAPTSAPATAPPPKPSVQPTVNPVRTLPPVATPKPLP